MDQALVLEIARRLLLLMLIQRHQGLFRLAVAQVPIKAVHSFSVMLPTL
jgi:hypothetical protein